MRTRKGCRGGTKLRGKRPGTEDRDWWRGRLYRVSLLSWCTDFDEMSCVQQRNGYRKIFLIALLASTAFRWSEETTVIQGCKEKAQETTHWSFNVSAVLRCDSPGLSHHNHPTSSIKLLFISQSYSTSCQCILQSLADVRCYYGRSRSRLSRQGLHRVTLSATLSCSLSCALTSACRRRFISVILKVSTAAKPHILSDAALDSSSRCKPTQINQQKISHGKILAHCINHGCCLSILKVTGSSRDRDEDSEPLIAPDEPLARQPRGASVGVICRCECVTESKLHEWSAINLVPGHTYLRGRSLSISDDSLTFPEEIKHGSGLYFYWLLFGLSLKTTIKSKWMLILIVSEFSYFQSAIPQTIEWSFYLYFRCVYKRKRWPEWAMKNIFRSILYFINRRLRQKKKTSVSLVW